MSGNGPEQAELERKFGGTNEITSLVEMKPLREKKWRRVKKAASSLLVNEDPARKELHLRLRNREALTFEGKGAVFFTPVVLAGYGQKLELARAYGVPEEEGGLMRFIVKEEGVGETVEWSINLPTADPIFGEGRFKTSGAEIFRKTTDRMGGSERRKMDSGFDKEVIFAPTLHKDVSGAIKEGESIKAKDFRTRPVEVVVLFDLGKSTKPEDRVSVLVMPKPLRPVEEPSETEEAPEPAS